MNIKMTFAGAGRLALLFLVGLNILYIGTHAFPAVLQRRNPQPVDRIRTLTPQRQTPHRPATQSDVFVNIQTSPNIVPDISGMRLGVEPETTVVLSQNQDYSVLCRLTNRFAVHPYARRSQCKRCATEARSYQRRKEYLRHPRMTELG